MNKSINLYLHVHQPFRIKDYSVFDITKDHEYFNATPNSQTNNEDILRKVSHKSYLPTNHKLTEIIQNNPDFKLSLSITGTVLEQLEEFMPEALDSFKKLVGTGNVEIVGETYHHSLAFFYNRQEFERQVEMHKDKIYQIFGKTPTAFRNTELAYNNDLAYWADRAGYQAILAEGWDKALDWRSPNYLYSPAYTNNIKLLLKNYKLSDDIAFRFGDSGWQEWPLTADKYSHWLDNTEGELINLFMDYETFGEHQWEHSGIFDFLEHLPKKWLDSGNNFVTVTEAANKFETKEYLDIPNTITWADTERDLSAWLGNSMQHQAIEALYEIGEKITETGNLQLIDDWRKLQTSDHFYYMCTKWFNDGDIHAYFSPYDDPYQAFIYFMNAYHDLRHRLYNQRDDYYG